MQGNILRGLVLRRDNPELLVAQATALSRQVPVMYLVVLVNALALAATHFSFAPDFLTIGVPLLLVAGCTFRAIQWYRLRNDILDGENAARMLSGTVRNAAILGVCFSAWSLSLYPYGDAYQRSHVAFFMAITVIACIFSLMYLRAAALLLTGCVLGPMIVFFGLSGQPVFQAIATNVVIVAAAMVMILSIHFREFVALVESKGELEQRAILAQRLNEENEKLAKFDSLTLLPNRRYFFSELDILLARTRETDGRLIVGVLDLDGFKPVNDAYGHATGDRLLVEVAQRLTATINGTIFIARLGGDEFGLIIRVPLEPDEILQLGKVLCDSLRAPYDLPGGTARITGTIGFCPSASGSDTAVMLYERADYALYHAKQHCKGSVMLFDARHEAEIRENGRVEQALRRADLEQELHLAFQPIIDIKAQRTVAFEALARWRSPELGDIPPNTFICAAERSGQIVEITRILVRKALHAAHSWPMDIGISINLSARDIVSMENVEHIIAIARDSNIGPHRIDFEITETAIIQDLEQAKAALRAFQSFGARTSLDDFGIGHSSLSHVRLLPFDKLKVDASFITDIDHDRQSEDIVKVILELCQTLRLRCIVEGIETEAQLDKVAAIGGAFAQGYLFARPMPSSAIAGYFTEETARAIGRQSRNPERDAGMLPGHDRMIG